MRKKLAVIVPTSNRENVIDRWLGESSHEAKKYGVDLIIYDSSSNDNTKHVTNRYIYGGYSNIKYKKYDGLFDGFSLDHKLISAYEEFADLYEYIWIIRDGLVPRISTFYVKLEQYIEERYPCIIVDADFRNFYVEKEIKYSDESVECEKFLREQAHRLQTLGMLIFSSEFALELIKNVPLQDNVYSLWQMVAPFHYYDKHPYKIVFYCGKTFTANPEYYRGHFWQSGEKLFEQWGYRWCHVIEKLPSSYDAAKNDVLKLYTYDFHPFSPKVIAELRAYSNLNNEMIRKYQQYLEKVTDTPLVVFYFIANTPRWLWKYVLKREDGLFARILCGLYLLKVGKYPVDGEIIL